MTVDAQILRALRETPGGVSGAELSRQLGMTRAGVWGDIGQLRALGYDIEASPHFGYRLIAAPDLLHADDLSSRLGQTRVIGREIHVFKETTSTNPSRRGRLDSFSQRGERRSFISRCSLRPDRRRMRSSASRVSGDFAIPDAFGEG